MGAVKRRVAFSLVVLLTAAGLAEVGARVGGSRLLPARRSLDAMPGETVPWEPNMIVDTVTGWRPRTGRQESFGIPGGTNVNARGLRGPELPLAKPAGERRVLLLGDSTVFGVLVSDADIFASRLERSLQAIDGQIHVLNGGAPGWSSWQARRAFDARLAAYSPDVVVIGTLWSDTQGAELADSTRFSRLMPGLDRSRAFLVVRDWVRELRWGSATEEIRVDLRPPGSGPPAQRPNAGDAAAGGVMPTPVIGEGGAPTLRVPLAEYRANLAALAAEVTAQGAVPAFLVLPCVRDPAGHGVGDFRDDYRAAMRETAAALHAPLADTPPAFEGSDPAAMFRDDVHPSAEGHARIAEVLTAALSEWARQKRGS